MKDLIEKKERLFILKEEREKNNNDIKFIEDENKILDDELNLILQSKNDLYKSVSNFENFNELKEETKTKIVAGIIISFIFSLMCTVTTFKELNLVAILISTPLISSVAAIISSIPYFEERKKFKDVRLDNLKLMIEKEELEKQKNREKYENNNIEIKKLLTKNRVLDSIINKIVSELSQSENTYNEPIDVIVENKENQVKQKVKTYSNK